MSHLYKIIVIIMVIILQDDPDMAKYIFKMCSLQHKFYRTNQFSQDR